MQAITMIEYPVRICYTSSVIIISKKRGEAMRQNAIGQSSTCGSSTCGTDVGQRRKIKLNLDRL